jgi:Phosphoesterase family
MGHGRYVGRIGALAVVLGVGYAVATTPAIASAAPSDSSSSVTDSPSGGDAASAAGTAEGHADSTKTAAKSSSPSTDTTVADEAAASVNDEKASAPTDHVDTLTGADHANSGAAHHSSTRKGSTADVHRPALRQPTDVGDSSVGAQHAFSRRQAQQVISTGTDDQPARGAMATAAAAVTTLSTPPPAVLARPDLHEALEEPHTSLVHVVAHVVDAVLEPLLAPFGPEGPGHAPLLWTMVAFVRDEFRRIGFPSVSADPGTPTLVDAPNLLRNPGAELGDPSLSGYSTVSVPGWAVTGTPTVIEYGTMRRFPVPTASPGPVLPGLLAFPNHGDAGSGAQFFGGGPVADSTLTQTVDLTAAADAIDHRPGGVQYELTGDLGGFLIDPSRTKVTVDFLGGHGAPLGTAALTPVTALDRWFMTDLIHRGAVGQIPVGARSARVVVAFDDHNPVLGNYNNAYADNLSFKIDADNLTPASLTPPPSTVGQLDHVFMVYLENKGVRQIVGSPNAPYLNLLLDQYGYASNYYGLTHPSDPNYTPVIGGTDFGFNYNCPSNCFPAGTPNLADTIEAAGLRWAGYAQGGGGYTEPTDRLPFLAFSDIYNDQERVATHLFDIGRLGQDLDDPSTAPNFVWFAADDATNMEGPTDFPGGVFNWVLGFLNPRHQYNVAAGDQWLRGPLTTIFDSATWQDPRERSAVIVTFDEDYNNLTTGVGNEGNHIVTIVIPSQGAVAGGMRAGHFVADDHYNHYSLLRTIEDSLGLPRLTNNDKFANPMNQFWVLPRTM